MAIALRTRPAPARDRLEIRRRPSESAAARAGIPEPTPIESAPTARSGMMPFSILWANAVACAQWSLSSYGGDREDAREDGWTCRAGLGQIVELQAQADA